MISPTTEKINRREKLAACQSVPTLETYLIASQDSRLVERYFRDHDNAWRRADFADEGSIPVPCLETDLVLAEVYEGL